MFLCVRSAQGGEKLKALQAQTGTRINIDRGADQIRISGTTDGCRKAKAMMEAISAAEANRDRVVLEVSLTSQHIACAVLLNGSGTHSACPRSYSSPIPNGVIVCRSCRRIIN